jgi:cold shock CspA family protein
MFEVRKIEGVVIRVSLDGHILPIESDGYLGKLTSGKALIEVYIQPGYDLYGLEVDGKGNVILKKDWGPLQKPPLEGKYYKKTVSIMKDVKGRYCTKYPNNNMRLLELRKNGELRIWQIALISQGGLFFLTVQQQYKMRCYREGGKVVCPPQPREWPQLVELLNRLLVDKITELSPITEYQPEPIPKANGLIPGIGRVLWWNFAMGLGAIDTREGQASVHWSKVAPRGRLAYLIPGELVKYRSLRPRTPKLPHKTSFRKEAIGVEPIT